MKEDPDCKYDAGNLITDNGETFKGSIPEIVDAHDETILRRNNTLQDRDGLYSKTLGQMD